MVFVVRKILFVIVILSHLSITSQIAFGDPKKINEQWKFIIQDNPEFKFSTYNDNKWETIDIPHDWSVKEQLSPTLASATGYLPGGIAWYRKTLNIPVEKEGQKVFLYFEGVYNRSEVFVNGKSLGKRPNGYLSFAYDATSTIKYGENNTIAVRVDHGKSADSRWYTGSGIYRNVWLVYSNPIHIGQWGVYAYPEIEKKSGTLNIEVELENESDTTANLTVVNELISNEGISETKSSKNIQILSKEMGMVSTKLKVRKPKLWSIDTPNLYVLKTTVWKDGELLDQSTTHTGFRKFTFDSNKGFALFK